MKSPTNLFADLPEKSSQELFSTLLDNPQCRIKKWAQLSPGPKREVLIVWWDEIPSDEHSDLIHCVVCDLAIFDGGPAPFNLKDLWQQYMELESLNSNMGKNDVSGNKSKKGCP